MTDPVVLLREAAQRATRGPWWEQPWGEYNEIRGCRLVSESVEHEADAEFIVAARNHLDAVLAEVVRLRAQVEAVRELHRPITEVTSVPGYRDPETTWTRCGSNNCNPLVWPCDTIRALGGSNPVADAIDARIRNGSTGERRDLLAGYVEQEPDDD